MRVAVLISGGGSNMAALVSAMLAGNVPATPVLVLANDAQAGGLGRAADMGVPTSVVDHRDFPDRESFQDALQQELESHGVELVCLAGFMRVLTGSFTERWEGRMLNIHPSLLPKYRGLNTHSCALKAGDTEAGCTVHLVTAELDDGPILGQASVPIIAGDTPETLAARVLEEEHRLYPATLKAFIEGV